MVVNVELGSQNHLTALDHIHSKQHLPRWNARGDALEDTSADEQERREPECLHVASLAATDPVLAMAQHSIHRQVAST
jgi:hypothetical protein